MLPVSDEPVEGEVSTPMDTSIVKPLALENRPEHSDKGRPPCSRQSSLLAACANIVNKGKLHEAEWLFIEELLKHLLPKHGV